MSEGPFETRAAGPRGMELTADDDAVKAARAARDLKVEKQAADHLAKPERRHREKDSFQAQRGKSDHDADDPGTYR